MPQQLPQIAILRIRYPDPREAIFQQEPQQQLRVLAIGLLLAHLLLAHSRGIADPQLKPQLDEQPLEPATQWPLASMPTRTFMTRLLSSW